MKRSSSASSASDSDSDSDSAADNKKKREEQEEEDLWQHLTYWTLEEEEEEDSEQVMDQDNNDGRVFAKIYTVDAENGATTEQLIELFDPFFDDGGVTDSELMMVCLVSGSL